MANFATTEEMFGTFMFFHLRLIKFSLLTSLPEDAKEVSVSCALFFVAIVSCEGGYLWELETFLATIDTFHFSLHLIGLPILSAAL